MALPNDMRITLIYQDFNYGWSETWWAGNYAPPGGGLDKYDGLIDAFKANYVPLRLAIMGNTSQLVSLRVSSEAALRDSRFAYIGKTGTYVDPNTKLPSVGSDRIYSAVRCRVDMGPERRAVKMVRGIPFGVIQNPDKGFANFPAAWKQAFADWEDLLTGTIVPQAPFPRLSLKHWGPAPGAVPDAITLWAPDPDPRFARFTAPGLAGSVRDRVRVHGVVPRGTRLNGDYYIVAVFPGDVYRVKIPQLLVLPQADGRGFVTDIEDSYPVIDRARYDGESSRKSGRPSGGPHGAAKARNR